MQVDVKFLFREEADFRRVCEHLEPCFLREERHTDFFFDFDAFDLWKHDMALRLRVPQDCGESHGSNCLATLTLKQCKVDSGSQLSCILQVKDIGGTVVKEILESDNVLDFLARSNTESGPGEDVRSRIFEDLRATAEREGAEFLLHRVATYSTRRRVYMFPKYASAEAQKANHRLDSSHCPLCIQMDETTYPAMQVYELEIPHVEIPLSDVASDAEDFLNSISVKYDRSLSSKYERFMTLVRPFPSETSETIDVVLQLNTEEDYNELKRFFDAGPEVNSLQLEGFGSKSQSHTEETGDRSLSCNNGRSSLLNTEEGSTQQKCSLIHSSKKPIHVGVRKRLREDEELSEEYRQTYIFDDPKNCSLPKGSYCVSLCCIKPTHQFIFEVTTGQGAPYLLQGGTRRCIEMSGDVARYILRDPTEFLEKYKDGSGISHVLWHELGLRKLAVIDFFQTRRRTYSYVIPSTPKNLPTQEINEGDVKYPLGSSEAEADEMPLWSVQPSKSLGHSELHVAPDSKQRVEVHLDRIVSNFNVSPEFIACSASNQSSSLFVGTSTINGAEHSFRVEVARFHPGTNLVAHQWLTDSLNRLNVKWHSNLHGIKEHLTALHISPSSSSPS
ncbi:CYTH domain [Trypanosoma vivax]|uniref:CYTH domain-containing protein n=1 Tax=Trypanosoma vivax (strain Y486) TaxID=1055687 RepID=G0U4R4_TRYVY|nr:hypothetical protein TRVL_01686 [Trypanosoma vivax]KAH8611299.1 CYTH domain [Trypanosoma vivax]CCC52428.1 conserved hypothetical protein [Trypanosoma vivax Y486]